jgi:hypothetical protein
MMTNDAAVAKCQEIATALRERPDVVTVAYDAEFFKDRGLQPVIDVGRFTLVVDYSRSSICVAGEAIASLSISTATIVERIEQWMQGWAILDGCQSAQLVGMVVRSPSPPPSATAAG